MAGRGVCCAGCWACLNAEAATTNAQPSSNATIMVEAVNPFLEFLMPALILLPDEFPGLILQPVGYCYFPATTRHATSMCFPNAESTIRLIALILNLQLVFDKLFGRFWRKDNALVDIAQPERAIYR